MIHNLDLFPIKYWCCHGVITVIINFYMNNLRDEVCLKHARLFKFKSKLNHVINFETKPALMLTEVPCVNNFFLIVNQISKISHAWMSAQILYRFRVSQYCKSL